MIKILVFGELCLDRYVYGVTERLSPEAPVPILKPMSVIENNGMAGNVVDNLRSLSDGIDVEHISQVEVLTKTRYVEQKSNHMFLRVDEGENIKISSLNTITTDLEKKIINADIVIISDYNKGFLSEEIISNIAFKSKFCVMDSKKKLSWKVISSIDFIKLNEIEYINNKEIVDSNLEKFVITLGSKGAKYIDTIYKSTKPQETIDVSGAGDSFISAFSLMYYKTKNISESINFANEVCGDVVSKKGVSLPESCFKVLF